MLRGAFRSALAALAIAFAVEHSTAPFAGSSSATHTLTGLVPGALYSVSLTNASGNKTASSAGVLQFTLSSSPPPPSRRRSVH